MDVTQPFFFGLIPTCQCLWNERVHMVVCLGLYFHLVSQSPPLRVLKKWAERAVTEGDRERGSEIDRGCWGKITPDMWARKRERILFWLRFPQTIADTNNVPHPGPWEVFSNLPNLTEELIVGLQSPVLLFLLSLVPLCRKWLYEHLYSLRKGRSVSKRWHFPFTELTFIKCSLCILHIVSHLIFTSAL